MTSAEVIDFALSQPPLPWWALVRRYRRWKLERALRRYVESTLEYRPWPWGRP
jgi:hypothetical protein